MTTLVEELRAELARAQAEGRELRAKLAIAEGERDGARALGAAWAEAADVVTPSDHTPEALRRRGESLVAQANAQARTLGEVAALRAERDAALAQTEQLTRGLTKADARRSSVDRCSDAWARIARAHRVDPSPANAERIAGLCESAAAVRDEVMAQRDALRAIIEGRDVAPTDDEIAAHEAAGGEWLLFVVGSRALVVDRPSTLRALLRYDTVTRIVALDSTGCPCAWPLVPEATRV